VFLTDPALRHVAAQTGDVWSEHIWRHDTATPGPVGVLAALLHKVTLRYNDNDNAEQLNRLLDTLGQQATSLREATARHASIPPSGVDRAATDLLDQIGRRVLLQQLLLHTYQAWRAHMPRPRAARTSGTCCCAPATRPSASQPCAASTTPSGWCHRTPRPPPRSRSRTPRGWSARSPNTATGGSRPPTATRSTATSAAAWPTTCHPTTTS